MSFFHQEGSFRPSRRGVDDVDGGAGDAVGDDGQVALHVRYAGAEEWYTRRGGTAALHDPADAQVLHDTLTAVLHHPEA